MHDQSSSAAAPAVQVLSSDRQRELYDLQLDRRLGRVLAADSTTCSSLHRATFAALVALCATVPHSSNGDKLSQLTLDGTTPSLLLGVDIKQAYV